MGLLNTGMNALGTFAAVKSLFGSKPKDDAAGKMNAFLSQIREKSVARANLFDVKFAAPKVMVGNKTVGSLSLYGSVAQLPGYYIQTTETARYGIGPSEKTAYGMSFNDITVKFIGDGKGEVYKFFYQWLQGIVRGDMDPAFYDKKDNNAKGAYEVEFREDYAVDIDIATYNEQGTETILSRLTSAYPINITEVELDWGSDSLMEFSVQFTYRRASVVGADQPIKDSKNGIEGLSMLQKLVKIGTAVQVISSIKRPANIQQALSSASTVKNLF